MCLSAAGVPGLREIACRRSADMGTAREIRQNNAYTGQTRRHFNLQPWKRRLFCGIPSVSKISRKIDRRAIESMYATPHIRETMRS